MLHSTARVQLHPAIDYVVNEEMPQVYVLGGAWEAELPEASVTR